MLDQQNIEINRWKWIFGPTIILGIAFSFLIPPAAPVFGVTLLAGGIYAYRRNTDKAVRAIAVAAIAAGAMLIVFTMVMILGLLGFNYGTAGSLIEGGGNISIEP